MVANNTKIETLISILEIGSIHEICMYLPKTTYQIPDNFSRAKRNFELLQKDFSKGELNGHSEDECLELLKMYLLKLIEYSERPDTGNKKDAAEFALKMAVKLDTFVLLATKNYCTVNHLTEEDFKIMSNFEEI